MAVRFLAASSISASDRPRSVHGVIENGTHMASHTQAHAHVSFKRMQGGTTLTGDTDMGVPQTPLQGPPNEFNPGWVLGSRECLK